MRPPADRRVEDHWRAGMDERLAALEADVRAIKQNTDEIVQFFEAGKGFFTVVRTVGSAAKWVAIVAAACGIAWGVLKFGVGQLMADIGIKK